MALAGMTELHVATFAELDAARLYAILRLRVEIFVVEQECPYQDLDDRDREAGTRHVWLTAAGIDGPVAYLRILNESDDIARIGRVCVAAGSRRAGHAATLIAAALQVIGDRVSILHAQTYATALYANAGFTIEGPEFVEDGIPHITMRRDPDSSLIFPTR